MGTVVLEHPVEKLLTGERLLKQVNLICSRKIKIILFQRLILFHTFLILFHFKGLLLKKLIYFQHIVSTDLYCI